VVKIIFLNGLWKCAFGSPILSFVVGLTIFRAANPDFKCPFHTKKLLFIADFHSL
jgi:hypothetical protein